MEKYTVIVPTRDRAETLEATLRTCLRQTYENFEVIVSDNCSEDHTQEIVSGLKDSRIRYLNTGSRLSMSGNFEFALQHATEGFVMFVGSDDGLMPDAIGYVDSIVKEYKVDAVSCRQATYVWPDFPDQNIAGRFVLESLRDGVEVRKTDEWIKKALSFKSFYCFDLPNLYCGFVNRKVIDRAYKDGRYFRSITPDAYSAFASAIFLERYAFSHRPFSIAGASVKSNGASGLHPKGDIKEAVKFIQENDIKLADGFVNCPSFEIILAETFAKLNQAFPNECSKYRIDYKKMFEGALRNVNSKTACEVTAAISIMANNFAVDIDAIPRSRVPEIAGLSLSSPFSAIKSMLMQSNKIVEIPKSTKVGIKDIDDAALFAHALRSLREGNEFVSARGAYWRRIRHVLAVLTT